MSILFSHFLSKYNEIRPQEADFTEVLDTIALKPKMLYFYGKMPENRAKNSCQTTKKSALKNVVKVASQRPRVVAVVGSRKPTKYGEEMAYKIAFEAARRGAVVVSGLAYGIDSIAHRAALEAGGVTVAVLGTPIDQIYPRAHVGLAEQIVRQGGAVMSELAPGVVFHPKVSFLERNRLIAGLADVVVIPEAAERSGSLNTAAHALEQGKELLAVPGDIQRPLSKGCNRLIKQGAMPCLEVRDVLEFLFPEEFLHRKRSKIASPPHQVSLPIGDNEVETGILRSLAQGIQDGEQIIQAEGLPVSTFNQTMTMLELKGRVKSLGANQWMIR